MMVDGEDEKQRETERTQRKSFVPYKTDCNNLPSLTLAVMVRS